MPDGIEQGNVALSTRTARRVVITVLVLVCGISACRTNDAVTTQAMGDAATEAGSVAAGELVGGSWLPPSKPWWAEPLITDRCGRPRTGLGAPHNGLLSEAESPILSGTPDSPVAGEGGVVRTAALAYQDRASAEAAVARLGVAALERCLVVTTNNYLDARDEGDTNRVAHATADSFDTTSHPISGGDQAILVESTYDAEVLGGHDNTQNVDLFVGRTGPVVVTVLVGANGQILEPEGTASLARRLGRAALTRAAQALDAKVSN